MTLVNQQQFNSKEYDPAKIVSSESVINWYNVAIKTPTSIVNVIQRDMAWCEDGIYGVGGEEEIYKYFTVTPKLTSPLPDDSENILTITYMGSLD